MHQNNKIDGFSDTNSINYTSESLTRNIISDINTRVINILNFDSKKIDLVVAGFLQKVSHQKDAKGQSNPRVVRSYIHAMLPEFKQSPEFLKLNEFEKRSTIKDINKYIHG